MFSAFDIVYKTLVITMRSMITFLRSMRIILMYLSNLLLEHLKIIIFVYGYTRERKISMSSPDQR